jgi:pimeloyl-ACP methyl ester carboxylesterase
MADMIDGVWVLVMARADEAGKILAEALSRREQGLRPVTLVGYSMGARLIFSCLKELAAKVIHLIAADIS